MQFSKWPTTKIYSAAWAQALKLGLDSRLHKMYPGSPNRNPSNATKMTDQLAACCTALAQPAATGQSGRPHFTLLSTFWGMAPRLLPRCR